MAQPVQSTHRDRPLTKETALSICAPNCSQQLLLVVVSTVAVSFSIGHGCGSAWPTQNGSTQKNRIAELAVPSLLRFSGSSAAMPSGTSSLSSTTTTITTTANGAESAPTPTDNDTLEMPDLSDATTSYALKVLQREGKRSYHRGDYERALACYVCAHWTLVESNSTWWWPWWSFSDPTTESLLLSNAAACRLQMIHDSAHDGAGEGNPDDAPPAGDPNRPHRGRPANDEDLVEAAIADARRCTELNPLWAGGHFRLAQALIASGRRNASNSACTILQLAIDLNPRLVAAKQLLRNELHRDGTTTTSAGNGGDSSRSSSHGEGHDGTAVPRPPRYELDETAVVTRRDRVALRCRRAKRYLQVNVYDAMVDTFCIVVIVYTLYFIVHLLVVPLPGMSGFPPRHLRHLCHDVQLYAYRLQYNDYKRNCQGPADATCPHVVRVVPESAAPSSGTAATTGTNTDPADAAPPPLVSGQHCNTECNKKLTIEPMYV